MLRFRYSQRQGLWLYFSVADLDPGSGAFLTPVSGIRDQGSGMGKKSRTGSGMNIPDHISESLETLFLVKIIKFFYGDPDLGSRIFLTLDPGWKKFGSGINIPYPLYLQNNRLPSFLSSVEPDVENPFAFTRTRRRHPSLNILHYIKGPHLYTLPEPY
jgi:hypothetical protein